ncbi:MAG TPA: hypothetical protein VMS12_06060 [Thermoanaerobaculia bacterium]|nr:hypothetical protein [Thermoanaerobaculia bacterium]
MPTNFKRVQIVNVLNQLRRASQVVIEGPDSVRRALEVSASEKGDFADYLIADA